MIPKSMLFTRGLMVMAVMLCSFSVLSAGDDEKLTPRSVPKFGGTEVESRVKTLMSGVSWHHDFDDAMARAAEEGKPLFWLQMVGDLDAGL